MSDTDLREVRDNLRATAVTLRAVIRFCDEVTDVAIELNEQSSPLCLRLLNAMRDLQAQTGEFVTTEETTD